MSHFQVPDCSGKVPLVKSKIDKKNRNATSSLEKLGVENGILKLTRIDHY